MDLKLIKLIAFIIFAIVSSIAIWIQKIRMKKRMEKGLSRKVSDVELTSFAAWMKMPPTGEIKQKHPPKV